MTATATPAPVQVFVGSGRKVHRAYLAANGQASTVCGAERRGLGVTYTRRTDAAVNCLACSPAAAEPVAEAPAAKRVSAAAAVRDEVTATVSSARFAAVRVDGRYRVTDRITNEYVATCASRAKAEEKATRLNDQEAEAVAADRPVMSDDELDAAYAAKVASEDEARAEAWGIPAVPAMQPCDALCCPTDEPCDRHDDRGAMIDALADSIQTTEQFETAVMGLLSGSVPATSLGKRAAAAVASEDRARAIAAAKAEVEAHGAEVAATKAAKAEAPAGEKGKAVRFHRRVHGLLLGSAGTGPGHPVAPVLARLAAAKTLTDGGRSIITTVAERAALRVFVSGWVAAEESATEPTLTVTDRNSLHAFLRSAWLAS